MDRPKSIEHWSPNYHAMDPGRKIDCVIIHATAGGKESSLQTLCDPKAVDAAGKPDRKSSHYLIDELGAIYHLVHEQNIAWHSGPCRWRGVEPMDLNNNSVGVELVNPNDGKTPYPEAQMVACANLVAAICSDYQIALVDLVSHAEVAVPAGRKTDPAGFDWNDFRTMVQSRLNPAPQG